MRHNSKSWKLEGIYKVTKKTDRCLFHHVGVSQYLYLIKEIVDTETSSSEFEIPCLYGFDSKNYYTCVAQMLPETSSESLFTSVTGKHPKFYGDHKVTNLLIGWCQSVYFPTVTGFVFPNLGSIKVQSGNIEFVSRKNFHSITKLVHLEIIDNPITDIPEDAFVNLIFLETLAIVETKIKKIHENLLANLRALKYFYAFSNVITQIDTKLFRNSLGLRSIQLQDNEINLIDGSFEFLTNLWFLSLKNNSCIDLNSYEEEIGQTIPIHEMDKEIEKNCRNIV